MMLISDTRSESIHANAAFWVRVCLHLLKVNVKAKSKVSFIEFHKNPSESDVAFSQSKLTFITTRKESCWKLMFSVMCVFLSVCS